jgi:uncharacterized protein (UPF0335 family)
MMSAPTEAEILAGMHSTAAAVMKGKAAPAEPPQKPSLEAPDEKKRLRSIVDRIVRLEEEKKGLGSDIKDIYTEAQSAGYSKKAVRIVVKRELEDADARASREASEAEAELMIAALGDFASSPLGESAVSRGRH